MTTFPIDPATLTPELTLFNNCKIYADKELVIENAKLKQQLENATKEKNRYRNELEVANEKLKHRL